MKVENILKLPSIPLTSPSYPKGPYRFIDREYFIINYLSDPAAIRAAVPEPLEPDGSNIVSYEFIIMPDSSGFGDYAESGVVIPCLFKGEKVNYISQMYLDCEPAIAGGREIWGFPKKHANPSLKVMSDTLTGKLLYAGELVAMGTMGYKHENLINNSHDTYEHNIADIISRIAKTQVNLKFIPDVDGSPAIVQLAACNMCDINIKGAWRGPARLSLISHVNAPVADLPVLKVINGTHFIADITLPYGRVIHDYLK